MMIIQIFAENRVDFQICCGEFSKREEAAVASDFEESFSWESRTEGVAKIDLVTIL